MYDLVNVSHVGCEFANDRGVRARRGLYVAAFWRELRHIFDCPGYRVNSLSPFLATRFVPYLSDSGIISTTIVANIAPYTYFVVPILWGLTFLVMSVYDPKRIYKAIDEFQLVAVATIVAALLFAGFLYLTYRDFSRWLFLIFVFLDLCLLLGWRFVARSIFKIGRLPAERSVLIVRGRRSWTACWAK
ncbi:MAG: hypothetical protein R3C44_03095 [Chloroflexota bacterium]